MPLETVLYALKMAKKHCNLTVFNPAPYEKLPDEIYKYIDYIVPNEHEFESLVPGKGTMDDKAKILIEKGVKNIIVTLGNKGSILFNKKERIAVDAIKVNAIDTTAAGDSYVGAIVYALSKDILIKEAMEFATKCSAITVTRKGAMLSLPKHSDLK